MMRILLPLFLILFISTNAQETMTKMGPILEGYGAVFQIEKPDLILNKDKEYKVIFDIYTDKSKDNTINPLINTVARYLNMHAQHDVPLDHMKIVIILHGAATKSALSAEAYLTQFKEENLNSKLLHALKEVNVETFVCGQSYLANGFDINDKSNDVKLALSALTALVKYQSEGYQIINFN